MISYNTVVLQAVLCNNPYPNLLWERDPGTSALWWLMACQWTSCSAEPGKPGIGGSLLCGRHSSWQGHLPVPPCTMPQLL